MGTFALPEKLEDFGYSVGSGTAATLYVYERLTDDGLVEHGDQVVVYVDTFDVVRAYARDGRTFHIDDEGLLSDGQGSTWDPLTGESETDGTGALTRLVSTPWLIKRWKSFYADGDILSVQDQ